VAGPAAPPPDPAVSEPPSLAELLAVLLRPLSRERPGLGHFVPGQAATAATALGVLAPAPPPQEQPVATTLRGRGSMPWVPLGAVVLATLTALLAGRGGWRSPRPSPPQRRSPRLSTRAARLAAVLALVGGIAPLSSSTGPPLAARPAPPAPGFEWVAPAVALIATTSPTSPGTPGAAAASPATPTAWTRLLEVERDLAGQGDLLAREEAAVGRLARLVSGHVADPDGPGATGPSRALQAQSAALSRLLVLHRTTSAAYVQRLSDEYAVYHEAAGDAACRRELLDGVAGAGDPRARAVVVADLEILTTQVNQEAAIAAAASRLAAAARLDPAQLEAIRRHDRFVVPEVAPVSQWFGPSDLSFEPPLSYGGVFHRHFHTGIDIAGAMDTPLHAAADGVVLLATQSVDGAGRLVGYGNYVVVAHADGFLTLYGHLDRIAVRTGDPIRQGQVIGLEGNTGLSTGPHVHFEVRQGGLLLDPAAFVGGQLEG
jgi:hypothetical protein